MSTSSVKMLSPRFLLLQSWRGNMGKWVQIGAPDAGIWSGEHLVYKFTVLREGRKPERLNDWLERWVRELEAKGYVPEVHLSNCWVMGGAPVAFDIVIDLEPQPIDVQLRNAVNVISFLRKYGVKAVAKVSSVREMNIGFHVYADLSQLWRLGLEEKWPDFYHSLISYINKVYNVQLDPAFAHKHQYRAFASPRAEKGDPMRLNCYNNYIPLPSLKELIEMGEKVSWELALEALKAELIEPLERIPRTGVVNANRFLAMFESLTSTVLKEEVKREVRARVLPVVKKLYRARARRWIERILERGLRDGRKRFIVWCAAPYLAGKVREGLMTEQEALQRLQQFASKAGEGKIRESQLRAWLRWALKYSRKPLSQASFLRRYPDLREVVGGIYGK
ncbi:MAG: hypothetical protein QXU64_04745 [Thermofilaceae archaeon]